MKTSAHDKQSYIIGPGGEKRPRSATAQAMHVMEILTGGRREEYVSPEQLRAKQRREKRKPSGGINLSE